MTEKGDEQQRGYRRPKLQIRLAHVKLYALKIDHISPYINPTVPSFGGWGDPKQSINLIKGEKRDANTKNQNKK